MRKLPQWEPLKNSVILLDGYTGFTPVQYRLAELFMIHSREVICCVTADPREMLYKECTMQHLFYMGRHTVCRLRKMAEEHHIPVLKEVWCDNRPPGVLRKAPSWIFWSRIYTVIMGKYGKMILRTFRSSGEKIRQKRRNMCAAALMKKCRRKACATGIWQ